MGETFEQVPQQFLFDDSVDAFIPWVGLDDIGSALVLLKFILLPSIFASFKGSTVSRAASEKEKAKEVPTLKDNDFLEMNEKLSLPDVSCFDGIRPFAYYCVLPTQTFRKLVTNFWRC